MKESLADLLAKVTDLSLTAIKDKSSASTLVSSVMETATGF